MLDYWHTAWLRPCRENQWHFNIRTLSVIFKLVPFNLRAQNIRFYCESSKGRDRDQRFIKYYRPKLLSNALCQHSNLEKNMIFFYYEKKFITYFSRMNRRQHKNEQVMKTRKRCWNTEVVLGWNFEIFRFGKRYK